MGACTVLPQLLTAHLLPRRPWSPRWLPTSNVMELNALEAAAHMLDGTAALMACTVLPQLLTAHLLPRRPWSPRWLPTSSVMELNARGCCPYVGWYCCPDGMYCAATAADCPYAKNYLQKLAS